MRHMSVYFNTVTSRYTTSQLKSKNTVHLHFVIGGYKADDWLFLGRDGTSSIFAFMEMHYHNV